jgi:D-serine deaminase-like pyridoxal phosphate-dependent protein
MSGAPNLGVNEALIGVPGSRWRLNTPALVLDLDIMEMNRDAMAHLAAARGVGLRPHAKAHKSLTIARLQIEAGARGVCCATLGEAEVMAGGGIDNVLITSPLTAPGKMQRLTALNAKARGLMMVADDVDTVARLDAAAAETVKALEVLVDVDIGQRRTGTVGVEGALAVARRIRESQFLEFAGVQAYAGHIQHIADYGARQAAATAAMEEVKAVAAGLTADGFDVSMITGAGTGTHDIDAGAGTYTEMQVGSYLFMDAQYGAVSLKDGDAGPFAVSLFVQSTVISTNQAGQATTDGGLKVFSTEGPAPVIATGAPNGATYEFTGDEFGCVVFAGADQSLTPGDVVACIVPHCDPTVNLHDFYHCVRGDTVVDIWPIDARGSY